MTTTVTGGCCCGAIRYECTADPVLIANCCCTDCQKTSGGQMSCNVAVPSDGFRISRGTTKTHVTTGESGNPVTRHFCGDCGSPIYSAPAIMPGVTIYKVGTLDDPSWAKPQMTIYAASAPPWASLPADVPRFPKMPPMG